jgi:hypothetical protein
MQGCQRPAYESREEARQAARRLMREGRGWLAPFVCRRCRRWHVGHPIRSAGLAVGVLR